MTVFKVYDPKLPGVIAVPPDMGIPREDQLQGCWFEQLSELAGRVCYDSLGKGRSSEEYHKHIQEVDHLSVYEHCNFTAVIPDAEIFNHRPGMYWRHSSADIRDLEVTLNLRTLMEWWAYDDDLHYSSNEELIYNCFWRIVQEEYLPKFIRLREPKSIREVYEYESIPSNWSTYFFRCSRACSHELVRHGDFTAISQRSTRYCNEQLDFSCLHPILAKESKLIQRMLQETKDSLQSIYQIVADTLIQINYSRKEALGAARCILPHYLATEVIFSASEEQWGRIKKQRVSEFADAEIRELISRVE